MPRALPLVLTLLVVTAGSASAGTVDDLWELAPSGVTRAMVCDGPTLLAMLDTAATVRGALIGSPTPELEAILRAATTVDGTDMLSPDDLRAIGVDPSGGLAGYYVGDDAVIAGVIADEQRFQSSGGKLRSCIRRGAYSVCAHRAEALATVGTNGALAAAAARRPAHMRAGLEGILVNDGVPTDVAVRITRGRLQAVFQAHTSFAFTAPAAPSPLAAHVGRSPATGILAIDLRGQGDVTPFLAARGFGRLAEVLRGDAVAVALRGAPLRGWVRLGLRDVAGARALLPRCGELPWPAPIRARGSKGACELTGLAPGGVALRLRVRVDGDTLVGETHRGAAAERGTPEPRIGEILARPWFVALWGRGLGSAPSLPDTLSLDLHRILPWWLAHVDELGVAVGSSNGTSEFAIDLGTAWQNPDAVLAPLEQIITSFVLGEHTRGRTQALAKQHPGTPLAHDVAAGAGGLVLPLGIFSALCDQLVPMLFPTAPMAF